MPALPIVSARRVCDPQAHYDAAVDEDCESRGPFLSASVETANISNPLARRLCTTLGLLECANEPAPWAV